jgi:pimeloyl-ACP methyl ester carboxylesterase
MQSTPEVGQLVVVRPYLAADHACCAFQVADYAKQFTCISVDPRGAGETDKPEGTYSMELFADDVAAFMQAIGVERAHVSGLSLGAATGLWLAGKYQTSALVEAERVGDAKLRARLKVDAQLKLATTLVTAFRYNPTSVFAFSKGRAALQTSVTRALALSLLGRDAVGASSWIMAGKDGSAMDVRRLPRILGRGASNPGVDQV